MNPFVNANVNVSSHSYGVRQGGPVRPESMYKKTALENLSCAEKERKFDAIFESKARQLEMEDNMSNSVSGKMYNQRLMNKMHEISCIAKEAFFADILYNIYESSLLLDDSFIGEKKTQLESFVNDYVVSNGGFKLLENAVNAHPETPILYNIKKVCEELSADVVEKKHSFAKDNQVPIEDIKFTMDDDCRDKLERAKSNLSIDELSDAVKSKVLTVIKDEKERQSKALAREEELENEAEEIRAQKEHLQRIKTGKIEESTSLFVAIMRNTYMDMIREGAVEEAALGILNARSSNDDADTEEYDIHLTKDELDSSESEENIDIKNTEDYVNGNHEETDGCCGDDDDEDNTDKKSLIGMDLVLAESIAKYTLLEVVSTIRLETFTPKMYEDMVISLLHE